MKDIYNNLNIIGSDETGVGDYFTPLVTSAVFLPYQNIPKVLALGVKDSKKLSDKMILDIFPELSKLIVQSTKIMSQSQYNFLTEHKQYNANELKMLLHIKAINSVEEKVKSYDKIIVDLFSTINSINKYQAKLIKLENLQPFKKEVIWVHRGEDEHPAVACASIVARYYLLQEMIKQKSKWDMNFPLGLNDQVKRTILSFVKKHGRDNLNEVGKLSFRTTNEVLNK